MVSLTPARIKEATKCDGLLLYIESYRTLMGFYYYGTSSFSRPVDDVLKIPHLFNDVILGVI